MPRIETIDHRTVYLASTSAVYGPGREDDLHSGVALWLSVDDCKTWIRLEERSEQKVTRWVRGVTLREIEAVADAKIEGIV